jgi:50S ribosomal protein L16 3-hydroxylase
VIVPHFGSSADEFLTRYWQKQPRMLRAAFPHFNCPISANDLAGLACEPGVLARLVIGHGSRFRVENGPFPESRFAQLPKKAWTLLVQNVDHWDADVRELLAYFRFLPSWRIEDVMVSYATTGGSVGAHVDQYDVFLLQARGQRRWQIDDRQAARKPENQDLVPGAKLKLLKSFHPNRDWLLQPGDMLYLPPGVPHHGIAVDDDCMTFSIGLRAPSTNALLGFALDQQWLPERMRYSDPDLSTAEADSGITGQVVKRLRTTLRQLAELDADTLAQGFAQFMSSYRAPQLPPFTPASHTAHQRMLERLQRGDVLNLAPNVRAVRVGQHVWIAGQNLQTEAVLAAALTTRSAIDWQMLTGLNQGSCAQLSALLKARVVCLGKPSKTIAR